MKIIQHLVFIYVCVFLTSIPFLFLAGFWIWAKIKDIKIENSRLKIFVFNALIYPFIFGIFFLIIFKIFVPDLLGPKAILQLIQTNRAAMLAGKLPPHGMLTVTALTNMYIAMALGLTQLISMGYALVSTALTFKPQPKSTLWTSYLFGFGFALLLMLLIYVGRNSIFEHLSHLKH